MSFAARQQDDLGQRLSPLRFNEAGPARLASGQATGRRERPGYPADATPEGAGSVTAVRRWLVFAGGGLCPPRQGDDQQPA